MRSNKFRTNLYKFFLIASIVPIILLFIVLVADNKNYINQHIDKTMEFELNNQIRLLEEWVEFKVDELNRSSNLVKYQLIDDNFSGKLKESLNHIVSMDDDIINAYVTTVDGFNMVSGENIPKLDGRTREWYINALEKDVNVTLPYVDVVTKSKVVTFSKVIKDLDGNVVAVVGIDCLLENVIKKYEKLFVKINGKIAIIDYDNNLIYKNEFINDEILNKYIAKDEFDEKIVDVDNKGYLFTKDIEKLNTKLIFYIERNEYINSIILINADLIIKLSAGIVGLIFIMIYFSKYISDPVAKIESEVKKFRSKSKFVADDATDDEFELEYESKNFDKLLNNIDDDELIELINLFVDYDKCLRKYEEELNELDLDAENIQNETEVVMVDVKDNQSRYVSQEKSIKVLENKYAELVSTNMDMIFLTDRSGVITFVSKMFEDTLKYGEGELIGSNISELIDEINNDSNLFKIFLKRDFESIDLVLNIKNSEKKVSVSCSMQRVFEDSKILMIQGICRDVSSEKQMYYDYFTRNRELFIVNEISKVMTNNNNLDKILMDIAEKINILLDVSLCTIRILEDDELKLRAYSGSNTRLKFHQNPNINDTHMGYSLKNRQIMTIRSKDDLLFRDVMLEDTLHTLKSVVYMPLYNKDELLGVLTIGSESDILSEKLNILSYLSDNASIAIEKTLLFEKLSSNYYKTITSLANAVEEKLGIIKGHTLRVSKYSVLLAKSMYLKESEIKDIEIAGLLHDIGKIGIKDSILRDAYSNKGDREEVLQRHTVIGKDILEPIGISENILNGIYLHHKNYDLSGYPENVEINEIPLIARIIAIANSFDNLMNQLENGNKRTIKSAFDVIRQGSGNKYCPEVVTIFENLVDDLIDEILEISKSSYKI